jgi:hypothetical protein
MSSSSAKIRVFPRSPRPLAPSMQWASRASSSPSPCLRWPPNPPSSAASSRASLPIPTASVVGRLSFFAIAGRRGHCRHRLPRPCPPTSRNLVVPPPPPACPLSRPSPPTDDAFLPRTLKDVLPAQRDADRSRVDRPQLSPPARDVPASTMEGASLRSSSLACPTIIAHRVLPGRHLRLIVIFAIGAGSPTLSPSRSHLLFFIVELNARSMPLLIASLPFDG